MQGFCTALEVALSTGPASKGNVNPAAAAACFMLCRVFSQKDQDYDMGEGIILDEAQMKLTEHVLGWARDCGLEIPCCCGGSFDLYWRIGVLPKLHHESLFVRGARAKRTSTCTGRASSS